MSVRTYAADFWRQQIARTTIEVGTIRMRINYKYYTERPS